jgi:Acetyltransferases
MKVSIKKIDQDTKLKEVSELAKEIWTEHYTSLIGPAQTEYMIEKFQSAARIKKDIGENGYSYFAVYDDVVQNVIQSAVQPVVQKPIGYLALQPHENELFISKLYVQKEYRNRGIATEMIRFSLIFAKENMRLKKRNRDGPDSEKPSLRLTVNKGNLGSIAFYKKAGFEISEEIVTDIGDGYFMDDYVMT